MPETNFESYPKRELHPATLRAFKDGHPWVTIDSFSKRFPAGASFIIGINNRGHEVALLLNDPGHPEIKARLWGLLPLKQPDFEKDLLFRFERAFSKRTEELRNERENYYLVFGEGDQIPGLFIQKMGKAILVHYYSGFWKKHEAQWLKVFKAAWKGNEEIWIQERNKEQKVDIRSLGKGEAEFTLKEFGLNYKITLGSNYDYGIYTDMSSVRKRLLPFIEQEAKVLNLYCYTGAYSLFSLKNGAKEVVSVDLSSKYLDWLDQNIALNPELDKNKHRSVNLAVKEALREFKNKNELFDLIICDPPSASSDGNKMSSAFKAYDELFPRLTELLSEKGKLLIFINTHQVSFSKWRQKVTDLASKTPNLKILKEFHLEEDCTRIKNFPEGDYLKGILLGN